MSCGADPGKDVARRILPPLQVQGLANETLRNQYNGVIRVLDCRVEHAARVADLWNDFTRPPSTDKHNAMVSPHLQESPSPSLPLDVPTTGHDGEVPGPRRVGKNHRLWLCLQSPTVYRECVVHGGLIQG